LTMPWASILKGRRNFKCEHEAYVKDYKEMTGEVLRADNAPCAIKGGKPACKLDTAKGCGYYRKLHEACENSQTILNYSYAIRVLQAWGLAGYKTEENIPFNPLHRQLLVCDEGDLAHDAIVDAFSISTKWTLWEGKDSVFEPAPPIKYPALVLGWKYWAEVASDSIREEMKVFKTKYNASLDEKGDPSAKMLKERRMWEARQHFINKLVHDVDGDWQAEPTPDGTTFRPLWARDLAGSMLWQHFDYVLIMSGTLGPPEILREKLGIKEDEYMYIQRPSTFPASNRPLWYWPVAKVSRNSTEEDFDNLAKALTQLANYGNLKSKKGLIHTGSYAIADKLWQRLQGQPHFMRHEGDRVETLRRYIDSESGILLTPSFTTGLDLPGQIYWQAIVKVPFGNLGSPLVKARRDDGELGKNDYDATAINTVVQAYGRAVRSEEDRGVTFMLEANFWPLYKRTFTPAHFQEAVKWLHRHKAKKKLG